MDMTGMKGIWKDDRLLGVSCPVDVLWKYHVYIVLEGEQPKEEVRKRSCGE